MSVSAEVSLPSQPSSGTVSYVPLGGDGFRDPAALYAVNIDSTGDGTGGNHTFKIVFDPQFESLVSFVNVGCEIASGTVTGRLRITNDRRSTPAQQVFASMTFRNTGLGAGNDSAGMQWSPAPMLIAPSSDFLPFMTLVVPNTNSQTLNLYAQIFLFKRTARQTTPMSVLLASLARASVLTVS